jgi:hypothetical protein
MSEKKVVRRSVAIALGIVCILLIAGIGGTTAYYSMVINDKNTAYDNYASSHSHTNSGFNTLNETYQDYVSSHIHSNSDYDSLNITYQNYVATHSHTNAEYDALLFEYNSYVANHHYTDAEYDSLNATYQDYIASHHHTDAEYNSLTAASLTTVGLDVTNFNHYWAWDPPSHLTIKGYIFNMGIDTAYNCKLHVKVWSSTDTLLLDTTVDLENISGRSYVYKSTETPYTGSGSYWEVIPEWTS